MLKIMRLKPLVCFIVAKGFVLRQCCQEPTDHILNTVSGRYTRNLYRKNEINNQISLGAAQKRPKQVLDENNETALIISG